MLTLMDALQVKIDVSNAWDSGIKIVNTAIPSCRISFWLPLF